MCCLKVPRYDLSCVFKSMDSVPESQLDSFPKFLHQIWQRRMRNADKASFWFVIDCFGLKTASALAMTRCQLSHKSQGKPSYAHLRLQMFRLWYSLRRFPQSSGSSRGHPLPELQVHTTYPPSLRSEFQHESPEIIRPAVRRLVLLRGQLLVELISEDNPVEVRSPKSEVGRFAV
jgi:hypothetical protein